MIVCVCEGVSDREIAANIQAGASSLSELGRRCQAGLDCGRCREMIRGMLGERRRACATDPRTSPATAR